MYSGLYRYDQTAPLGKPSLVINLKKVIQRYKRVGYNIDIMQQSACLVVNPITVYSYGFLFNCTTVGQASDSMTALTYKNLAGPTVAQLEVFFSSDYL